MVAASGSCNPKLNQEAPKSGDDIVPYGAVDSSQHLAVWTTNPFVPSGKLGIGSVLLLIFCLRRKRSS